MKQNKISQAEAIRYDKIQRLVDLLNKKDELTDVIAKALNTPFNVGGKIVVDNDSITIGNKTYEALDIKRVTINTEGSISIFDRYGKKICGWSRLNLSCKNIELFCLWVRKNGIPAEVVSGRHERVLLVVISVLVTTIIALIKILKYFHVF